MNILEIIGALTIIVVIVVAILYTFGVIKFDSSIKVVREDDKE